jgi:hypothetical protein
LSEAASQRASIRGNGATLNPTEVLACALGKELAATYRRAFSGREPRHTEVIAEAARLGYANPADFADQAPNGASQPTSMSADLGDPVRLPRSCAANLKPVSGPGLRRIRGLWSNITS